MGSTTISRTEYIRNASHSWALIDFIPTGVQQRFSKDTDWVVSGCALVDVHGQKKKWETFVEINLRGPQQTNSAPHSPRKTWRRHVLPARANQRKSSG